MLDERNIIFEDSDLLVVDKPSGILIVPTPKKEKNTLTDRLNGILQTRHDSKNATVYPCHRLDRDASGIIIYAKNKETKELIMQQFKNGNVKKKYIAFVKGKMKRNSGVLSFPVENKKSVTKYKLLQIRKGYSIMEVEPLTGRTNQIRIHFAMISQPLLGERKFAFGKDFKIIFRRVALHACEIRFKHPYTKETMEFRCGLPNDMSKFAGWQLRNNC